MTQSLAFYLAYMFAAASQDTVYLHNNIIGLLFQIYKTTSQKHPRQKKNYVGIECFGNEVPNHFISTETVHKNNTVM